MLFASGGYTGNGTDNRAFTGVGFSPSALLITCTSAAQDTVFKTTDMAGDASIRLRNDSAIAANKIQSLDADGFTVGTDADVNTNTATYQWAAFKDNGAGDFQVFTYTGNGVDDRNITLNFNPCWVVIKSAGAITGSHRTSDEASGNSLTFYGGAEQTNRIQTFGSTFVQVGTDSTVNTNTTVYYGMAFKAVTGNIATVTYTGNGVDDRTITTNFQPRFVMVKQSAGQLPYWRSSSFDAGQSVAFAEAAQAANEIQAMLTTGFQVGTGTEVNQNTSTYYSFAIGANTGGHFLSILGVGT